jgi:acyl-CoA synthetase (AMP-forming)/AMP-acid ligase II
VAFVALREALAEAEPSLRAFCAARLAAPKVPARVVVQADLPKLAAAGKIDKASLRERARDNYSVVTR